METRGIVIEDGAVLHSKVATPQAKAPEAAEPETAEPETAAPETAAPETAAAVEPAVSNETRAKTAGA
jgi:hypothetical protein